MNILVEYFWWVLGAILVIWLVCCLVDASLNHKFSPKALIKTDIEYDYEIIEVRVVGHYDSRDGRYYKVYSPKLDDNYAIVRANRFLSFFKG